MADELELTARMKLVDAANSIEPRIDEQITVDITGTGDGFDFVLEKQNIPATGNISITLGNVTTPGYAFIYNNDDTNYVTIRNSDGGDDTIKILAGEFAIYRMNSTTPHALADTAAVDIIKYIVEA